MKVRFKESFARDLRNLKDKALLDRIRALIENVEKAESLADVAGLKKLRGLTTKRASCAFFQPPAPNT